MGKIQDLMAKMTEVPHELRVSWPIHLIEMRIVLADPR